LDIAGNQAFVVSLVRVGRRKDVEAMVSRWNAPSLVDKKRAR